MFNYKASEATTESLPVLGSKAGGKSRHPVKGTGRSVVIIPPDPTGEGTDHHISSTVLNAVETTMEKAVDHSVRRRDIRNCRQKISDKTKRLASRMSGKKKR